MGDRHYTVLFLCIGNSAWSPMAEALMNRSSRDVYRAHSAGIRPAGELDPLALHQLRGARLTPSSLQTRYWLEFLEPGAPRPDFVFTAFDAETEGLSPAWPEGPFLTHWNIPDPARFEGTESGRREAFQRAFMQLQRRIQIFLSLPLAKVDRLTFQGPSARLVPQGLRSGISGTPR